MGAIGEKRFGAAREYTDFVYSKASHGIGASMVLDGRVYRGSLGIAGEIGHTHMPGTFNRCRCGKQGCLEAVISVPEVRRQLTSTHLRENTDGHEPPSDPLGEMPQQQSSPRQASRPSRTATAATARPMSGSSHHQPNQALATRPTRTAPAR